MDTDIPKDFFISYSHADQRWAEWIAWHLEEAGYSTLLQAWDFLAGSNFVLAIRWPLPRGAKANGSTATQDGCGCCPSSLSVSRCQIFEGGAAGLSWWSAIEASWPNVTLFAERSVDRLVITGEPEVLSVDHATVVAAAAFLGIGLGA